jgi:hypothetical protein
MENIQTSKNIFWSCFMAQRSKSHSKKAAYWRRMAKEWKRSGQSQAAFCQARELKLTTFRWWRHQLLRADAKVTEAKRTDSRGSFIPVRIIDTPSSPSQHIEILLSDSKRIQIPPGFDPNTLRQVLAILDELAC